MNEMEWICDLMVMNYIGYFRISQLSDESIRKLQRVFEAGDAKFPGDCPINIDDIIDHLTKKYL